jgi:hypothetical protein
LSSFHLYIILSPPNSPPRILFSSLVPAEIPNSSAEKGSMGSITARNTVPSARLMRADKSVLLGVSCRERHLRVHLHRMRESQNLPNWELIRHHSHLSLLGNKVTHMYETCEIVLMFLTIILLPSSTEPRIPLWRKDRRTRLPCAYVGVDLIYLHAVRPSLLRERGPGVQEPSRAASRLYCSKHHWTTWVSRSDSPSILLSSTSSSRSSS